jgi:uncharacterized protein YjbJ (UPF0337 family)
VKGGLTVPVSFMRTRRPVYGPAGPGRLSVTRKERHMPNMDEMKGRAKRAGGELSGDDKMKREGSIDKAAGKSKDAVNKTADKAKDKLGRH